MTFTFDDLPLGPRLKERLQPMRAQIDIALASQMKYRYKKPGRTTLHRWANDGSLTRVNNEGRPYAASAGKGGGNQLLERRSADRSAYKDPLVWARHSWRRLRRKAYLLGMEFNLEITDLVPPKSCPVLGIEIAIGDGRSYQAQQSSPSIDRFDNSKGYIKSNIRIISKRANALKSDATLEEMERLVAYMRS
jgi:hypothetical protein